MIGALLLESGDVKPVLIGELPDSLVEEPPSAVPSFEPKF